MPAIVRPDCMSVVSSVNSSTMDTKMYATNEYDHPDQAISGALSNGMSKK